MGSSKKTKDKDRDRNREEKRKRKHRSRSRDRHHRHKHKKKSHRRDLRSRSRSPLSDISDGSSVGDDVEIAPPAPQISTRESFTPPSTPPPEGLEQDNGFAPGENNSNGEWNSKPVQMGKIGAGWQEEGEEEKEGPVGGEGGAGLSLSIEETNKLRAKLGLKPLKMDNNEKDESEKLSSEAGVGKRYLEDGQEFVHKPAENIADKLQVDKLREKIAAQREKRRLKEKMSAVRGLADSDSDEDALAWVNKNKKLSKDRQEAERKAKQLEELDAEFGIGELVEEEVAKEQRFAYGRSHLAGMKVQHDVTRFGEGSTILTLADADVLADSEDTLVNVNFLDDERAERNVELRRSKPDEPDEYEAPEVDEQGHLVTGHVLKKYDEELSGPKKQSFRLGRHGQAAALEDASLTKQQRMMRLKAQLQSLSNQNSGQLVNEYMTQNEVMSFRKVKNKKKKKKKMLTADELDPVEGGEVHHGSRSNRVISGVARPNKPPNTTETVKSLRELMEEDEDDVNAEKMEVEVTNNASDDDEGLNDDHELQEALANARKAQLSKNRQPRLERIKEMLDTTESSDRIPGGLALSDLLPDMDTTSSSGGVVTLNTTDEFCRTLGDLPTYGLSGNRAEEEQNAAAALQQLHQQAHRHGESSALPASGAWEEVGIDDTRVEITEAKAAPILDEEPEASTGVASALRLAIKKGYLDKAQPSKKANAALQHLRAVNYSIDDKIGDDDRGGRGGNAGDRYTGPLTDFKEKEGYKPKIALEYVDDEGRKLCPKEAFRYLSHKFHGKGSGKNKTEKRMKKWNEELLMKQMSSSDTPLQTLERQIEKQKALGASYLILSGSKNQEPTNAVTKITK